MGSTNFVVDYGIARRDLHRGRPPRDLRAAAGAREVISAADRR
jgi:hypothetical protein